MIPGIITKTMISGGNTAYPNGRHLAHYKRKTELLRWMSAPKSSLRVQVEGLCALDSANAFVYAYFL